MNKYSGVTLDYYDDDYLTLKALFPENKLPDVIKQAQVKPADSLPNEAFALVAWDNGSLLRKYACTDPGTTAMSVAYFMEHGAKLPDTAIKLAADNLVSACVRYGILPPERLTKVASMNRLGSPEFVDITGQGPTPKVKSASTRDQDYCVVTSLGERLYPIDTWDKVKTAAQYFEDQQLAMDPEVRRQYAVKLAAKAKTIGFPVSNLVKEAGAPTYADAGHVKMALGMREAMVPSKEAKAVLHELKSKLASLEPETFALVLRKFDIQNGLDHAWGSQIPDPWGSTFGVQKIAEVLWADGADRVTERELRNLAENHLSDVKAVFTWELAQEFMADPVSLFESLPLPQKKVMARLATDNSAQGGAEGGYQESNPVKVAAHIGDIEDALGFRLRGEDVNAIHRMENHHRKSENELASALLKDSPSAQEMFEAAQQRLQVEKKKDVSLNALLGQVDHSDAQIHSFASDALKDLIKKHGPSTEMYTDDGPLETNHGDVVSTK